jgi:uncharacterized protein YutE (UPF0331/DUF86 family)
MDDIVTRKLRNLAVHDYSALDWKQLHEYLPAALADLRAYAASIQRQTP